MFLRLAFAGALAGATLAAAAPAPAATITTGDAYSNGSGGTSSTVRARFDAAGCTGAVSYEIGTVPLAQGGFRTVASASNTPASLPGRTFDVTTIPGLTTGTLYYYRALLATHNCATAGEAVAGAQQCLTKKGSINELETVACPGAAPAPPATPGGGSTEDPGSTAPTDKCKKAGSCPSNRIKLPGRYCTVTNDPGQTFMFVLKVKNVSCKTAESLVDRNSARSGKAKRFRLRPSKATCKAIRSVGTGVEYECKLRKQRLWYFGYGSLTLDRQIWTNLYPKGS